jgi:hypothetical protein
VPVGQISMARDQHRSGWQLDHDRFRERSGSLSCFPPVGHYVAVGGSVSCSCLPSPRTG